MINKHVNLLKKYSAYKFLILGIVSSIILSFLYIGNKNLFLDEVASVVISRDFSSMFTKFWLFDGNMWFYYTLLHFWSYLGDSELILRSFSVIWTVATLVPLYLLTQRLFSRKTADIAITLIPFHILFIKNAQFVRGYSLLLFLTTLASYIFIRLTDRYKYREHILYVAIGIAAIYTHLFAVFVLGAHFIYTLLFYKSIEFKKFFLGYIITALSLIPLVISPAFKSGQVNWIPMPDLYTLAATFVFLTNDFIPISVLCLGLLLYMIKKKKKKLLTSSDNIFIFILLLFPLVIVYIFSLFIKPIYNIQYFTICLVPMIIFVAYAISLIHKKRVMFFVIALFIIGGIIRLSYWYNETNVKYFVINNQNTDWKGTAKYIALYAKENDVVIVYPNYSQISFDYYYSKVSKNDSIDRLIFQSVNIASGVNSPFNKDILKNFSANESNIWLIRENGLISNENTYMTIQEELNESYTPVEEIEFYQTKITKYEN